MATPLLERVLPRLEWGPIPEGHRTRCLLWTGAKKEGGHGVVWSGEYTPAGNPGLARVHVALYEHWMGSPGEGQVLHHTCFTPACANPDHLLPCTQKEHMRIHGALTTHCPQGHEYTEANTYYRNRLDTSKHGGWRECRECRKAPRHG